LDAEEHAVLVLYRHILFSGQQFHRNSIRTLARIKLLSAHVSAAAGAELFEAPHVEPGGQYPGAAELPIVVRCFTYGNGTMAMKF
jgi:hypothetical protein